MKRGVRMALHFGELDSDAFDEFGIGIVALGLSAIVSTAALIAISVSRYGNRVPLATPASTFSFQ